MQNSPESNRLTVTQLAEKAGVSRQYVLREIKSGRLHSIRVGNQHEFEESVANAWLQKPRRGSRRSK